MSYTLELNDRQVQIIEALVGCVANETHEHMKPLTEEVFDDVMDLGSQIACQYPHIQAKRSMSVPFFMDESIICNVPRSWIAWNELNMEGDL